jgi:hypothetical protein
MSEAGIYTTLTNDSDVSGLVSTRVYPVIAPQDVTAPYVVYMRIVGTSVNDLGGELGITNGRFQIDAYATTYAEVKTLAGYVKAAMKASSMKSRLLTDQDFSFEVDTQMYRVSMDFQIWVTE